MSAVPPIQSWGFGPSFGTSFSLTSGNPVTAGSLIVVSIFIDAYYAYGVTTVSDSAGNIYTVDAEGIGYYTGVASTTIVLGGGAALTILVDTPLNSALTRVFVSEYASALSPRFDTVDTASAPYPFTGYNKGVPTPISLTTASDAELLVCLTLWQSLVTPVASAGYTLEDTTSFAGWTTAVQDSIAGIAGIQTITPDDAGSTSGVRSGLFAAYRVASTTNASVNLTGVSATSLAAIVSEKGSANPVPAGNTTSSVLGNISSSGGGKAPLIGTVSASSLTNISTSTSNTNSANITVFGVSAAISISALFPSAGANVTSGSNATIPQLGTVAASVGISVFLVGVSTQPRAALVSETGSANVYLFGVATQSVARLPISSISAHGTTKVIPAFSAITSVLGISGTTEVM